MRMCLLLSLLLSLSSQPSNAQQPLSFAAQIEDEQLAEEAILLLHCLSHRSGRPWEFTGDARGEAWLKVQERNRKLEGVYRSNGKEQGFELAAGESDAVCDKLEQSTMKPEILPADPVLPREPIALSSGISGTWLWAGAGLAVAAGFLYWKSKQPAYKTILMQ